MKEEAGHELRCKFFISVSFIVLILSGRGFCGDYFQCADITYFYKECPVRRPPDKIDQTSTEKPVTQTPDKNIWAEPTLGADGTISYKIPPLPVMKILDNPSPENVKQYVDWNNERMDRIRKATEALRTATLQPSHFNIGDISRVDFFFSPTCPYCKMQAPIVQQFAEKIGIDKATGYAMSVTDPRSVAGFINGSGITFKVLSGENYGKANNVTGWPTILVHFVTGKTKRIDGFSQSIEAELTGTAQPGGLEEILPLSRGSNQCSSAYK